MKLNNIPEILTEELDSHRVLNNSAMKVRREDLRSIRDFMPQFFRAMVQADGIGLAAPQVGIPLRFALVATEATPIVLINPRIVDHSDIETVSKEGCLSLPGVEMEIMRYKEVSVQSRDFNWNKITYDVDGLTSICMQHEIDHLDGVLITSRKSLQDMLSDRISSFSDSRPSDEVMSDLRKKLEKYSNGRD